MPDLEQTAVAGSAVAKTKITIPTDKYVSSKSASGSKSQHNGDVVASALAGQPVSAVFAITGAMGTITAEDLEAKYAHLNIGQQRMNLGNRIRGAVAKMDKAVAKDAALGDKAVGDLMGGEEYLLAIVDGFPLPEPEPVAAVSEDDSEDESEQDWDESDEDEDDGEPLEH
jgi:hypothetical protein